MKNREERERDEEQRREIAERDGKQRERNSRESDKDFSFDLEQLNFIFYVTENNGCKHDELVNYVHDDRV